MKSFYLNKAAVAAATALAAVAPAFAQSSVTLYGIVDDSFVYKISKTSLGSTQRWWALEPSRWHRASGRVTASA